MVSVQLLLVQETISSKHDSMWFCWDKKTVTENKLIKACWTVHNIKVEGAGGTQQQFPPKYIENTV